MNGWCERPLGLRWTVGDVSARGFQALRLALRGARRVFGPDAGYVVYVNSIGVDEARRRTGDVPPGIAWRPAEGRLSRALAEHLDDGMAEGVAWKFFPLRAFPDRWELAFDNDCILWEMPSAIAAWLESDDAGRCLLASDVVAMHGRFAALLGDRPINTGIRGMPPGFDLEAALAGVLRESPGVLRSELDEQGLQAVALSREAPPFVVETAEVSICSPFPPHQPGLGTRGAHFVGLNAKRLPWSLAGRNAAEWHAAHWDAHRAAIAERVGAAAVPLASSAGAG